MYTVTIAAPNTQEQGIALINEVEYIRANWQGFKFTRRYLLVKEVVESKIVNLGFNNFSLEFTFSEQHQARFFQKIFKGTIQ